MKQCAQICPSVETPPLCSSGQDSEHEVARCAAPLLFSFSDREANPMVVARVGNQLHPGSQAQVGQKEAVALSPSPKHPYVNLYTCNSQTVVRESLEGSFCSVGVQTLKQCAVYGSNMGVERK